MSQTLIPLSIDFSIGSTPLALAKREPKRIEFGLGDSPNFELCHQGHMNFFIYCSNWKLFF